MAWGAKYLVQCQNLKGYQIVTVASSSKLDKAIEMARKANAERRTDHGLNPRFAVVECKVIAAWENGEEVL